MNAKLIIVGHGFINPVTQSIMFFCRHKRPPHYVTRKTFLDDRGAAVILNTQNMKHPTVRCMIIKLYWLYTDQTIDQPKVICIGGFIIYDALVYTHSCLHTQSSVDWQSARHDIVQTSKLSPGHFGGLGQPNGIRIISEIWISLWSNGAWWWNQVIIRTVLLCKILLCTKNKRRKYIL